MVKAGQRLKNARIAKKLSLEDVAKATKIRTSFLQAIEKGEYQNLPSSAYATGFVRNYAAFVGLSEREILAVFRREFDEEKVFKVLPDSLARQRDFPRRSVRIQQTLIIFLVVMAGFISYIGYQYRFLVVDPPLSLTSPKDQAEVLTDIQVIGKTDRNATVTINNTPVTVDENGNFTKKIALFPGKGTISVIAKNRIGREIKISRSVNVKESTNE